MINKLKTRYSIFKFTMVGIVVLLINSLGCVYSFKGGSAPTNVNTIAIPLVEDNSGYGEPFLRDEFYKILVERFIKDNTLQVTDRLNADAALEGVISDYKDTPESLQGNEVVSSRKITLTVRVTLRNLKQNKVIWEKTLITWGIYPSGGGASQRNNGALEAIQKLTEDILNETVSGW